MLLIIDNYDSFTYNLVQYCGELGADVRVYRHDGITVEEAIALSPTHIIISPGPGNPSNAGISTDIIRHFYPSIPVLGVCLGHQCIGALFGATITHAPTIMHGKTSLIYHDNHSIHHGIPSPFTATRYHSLIIQRESLPTDKLMITAWTEDNIIMGIKHNDYPLEGIQYHPESILTEQGKPILDRFLKT